MRRNNNFIGRRFLLAATDALLAFVCAMFLLRYAPGEFQVPIAASMVLATIVSLVLSGAYVHVLRKPLSWHQYSAALAACFAGISVTVVVYWLGIPIRFGQILLATAGLFVALLAVRIAILFCYRSFAGSKRLWVIAEDSIAAAHLASKVGTHACCYEVWRCSGPPSPEDLASELAPFDAVLCTASLRKSIQDACKYLGKELLFVPDVSDVMLYTASAQQLDDLLIFSMPPLRLTAVQSFIKRCCDVLGSVGFVLLSAPVMLFLYVLIPLESRGPAIFKQERRGLNGRSFQMLKFRTMLADAEDSCGPVLATREDPRVTRIGNFLRATRLDELPQLFNVLRGEMSLVGPRPEREFFATRFDQEVPGFNARTAVKPGLTGMAQVWGGYATCAADKVRLDLMYIANYSILLDLNLLLQTVRVVFYRSQSAGLDPSTSLRFGLTHVRNVDKQSEA